MTEVVLMKNKFGSGKGERELNSRLLNGANKEVLKKLHRG
jgi:hypothetical protein